MDTSFLGENLVMLGLWQVLQRMTVVSTLRDRGLGTSRLGRRYGGQAASARGFAFMLRGGRGK